MSLTDLDYQSLADFRFEIRRFLAFAEENARTRALSVQQHQALLAIRGSVEKKMTVGELSERLFIQKHSASELVKRLVSNDLVVKASDHHDARRTILKLTAKAEHLLAELSDIHRAEIQRMQPLLSRLLQQICHS